MIPHPKFKISYQKDITTLFAFINEAKYNRGRALKWGVLDKYPVLRKYRTKKDFKISKKEASEFIQKIYRKDRKMIQRNLNSSKDNWQKKEKQFYQLVEELFGKRSWPKGKYIAYPTIWGMFPRFLEDKTFQIPYKYRYKRYINVIIAHEMLHFMFYDYFFKRYPRYKKEKYSFLAWHTSEIFNSIVQKSPKWLKVFEIKSRPYPEHRKIVRKLSPRYDKEIIDIKKLIKDIMKAARRITSKK